MRLDVYLYEKGLAKSRSFAKELIEGGYVKVSGKAVTKPSAQAVGEVEVTGAPYEYVSRGGLKLAAALDEFGISPQGRICVDIGASSGGFTDCLVRRGAEKVYAVDSGHGQLAPALSSDSRVLNIEGLNARGITPADINNEKCSVAVADVSFISQTLIIPRVPDLLTEDGVFLSLIKPQFECGRSALSKGGIVRDKKQMVLACEKVISCAAENNLGCTGLIKSPVTGGDGNTEFLMLCIKAQAVSVTRDMIKEVCAR